MLGPWKHGKGILREENENRDKVEEILDPSSEQVSQQYTGHMTFSDGQFIGEAGRCFRAWKIKKKAAKAGTMLAFK